MSTELSDLPSELLPEILIHLDFRVLVTASEVSHAFLKGANNDDVWRNRVKVDYPLFADQLKASKMKPKEFYIAVKRGQVVVVIQVYDSDQVNCKDCYAAMTLEGYLKVAVSYHTVDFFNALETMIIDPNDPRTPVRARPAVMANLEPYGQLYIPPLPFSQYFKPGEEIELQWGAGYYWWRGVVDKIEHGERMTMIFTHFGADSSYYREVAIYGIENGACKGVRKLSEEEKMLWRRLMTETGKTMWPVRQEDQVPSSLPSQQAATLYPDETTEPNHTSSW